MVEFYHISGQKTMSALNTMLKQEINLPVPARIDYLFTSNAKGWIKKKTKRFRQKKLTEEKLGRLLKLKRVF